MSGTALRLLDQEHHRVFHVWRVKSVPGPVPHPVRGCHIRVYRQKRMTSSLTGGPAVFALLPLTHAAKQNHVLRQWTGGGVATLPPVRRRRTDVVTDIFRFSQTAFPVVLLEQVGPYWVIPSPTPRRIHVYLTRQQLEQIDSVHWTIQKTLDITRHQWRALLRHALNPRTTG